MDLPKRDREVTQRIYPDDDRDSSTADEAENESVADVNTEQLEVPELHPAPPVMVNVKPEPEEQRAEENVDKIYIKLEVRNLTVLDQIIQFKLKRTSSLKKLMAQFCHKFVIE